MGEKPQNLPGVESKNIAKITADSFNPQNIVENIAKKPDSVKKKIKEEIPKNLRMDAESIVNNFFNLDKKESKEKHSEKVKDSIMMQTMNPESVDGYVDRLKAKIAENGGQLTLTKDIQKARLELNREIYSERKEELDSPLKDKDGKDLYDKEGKIITKTKYQDILEKNKDLAKLNTKQNPELAKELLAVYGEKGISDYKIFLKDIPEDKIPKNLEEFDKIITKLKIIKRLKEESLEANEGDETKIPTNEELDKSAANIISKGPSSVNNIIGESSSFNPPNYGEVNFERGKDFSPEIREKLEKIYSSNSIEDRRMLDTLNNLSDIHNAKTKFAKWCIKSNEIGFKLTQGNNDEGGIRTLQKQREIMERSGATWVSEPENSWHTKGAAIDIKVNGKPLSKNNEKVIEAAADIGLFVGGIMWGGIDFWHVQAGCSGKICKNMVEYNKKSSKNLLPKNVNA